MKAGAAEGEIGITAIGMTSSLGFDAPNACAAARAGLSRAAELDHFQIKSGTTGEVVKVHVHQVPITTRGFEAWVRLLVLLKAALADLAARRPLDDVPPERLGLYLALPDSRRVQGGLDLIGDEATRNTRAGLAGRPRGRSVTETGEQVRNLLSRGSGLKLLAANCSFFSSGQCGVAEAALKAAGDLNNGYIDCALVGAADSMIEEGTLEWLIDTGRLKLEGMPAGLRPGEAAGFFVLERGGTNQLAGLGAIRKEVEEATLLSGCPPLGVGLARCLKATLAARKEAGCPIWVLTDQNGEPYRSSEWGLALNRLLTPDLADISVWYPAASFGDTGTASGMMAICLAVQAFARGYAPSNQAFVVSSSDGKERAAILLRAGCEGKA